MSGNPYRAFVLALAQPADAAGDHDTTPWLPVLQGGARCSPNTGQAPYVGNDRANYSCDTGGTVYGFLDRTRQPWRIRYLPKAIITVPVRTAWT